MHLHALAGKASRGAMRLCFIPGDLLRRARPSARSIRLAKIDERKPPIPWGREEGFALVGRNPGTREGETFIFNGMLGSYGGFYFFGPVLGW